MSDLNQSRNPCTQVPTTAPHDESAKTGEAFERAKSDLEAIYLEGFRLERQGELDAVAKQKIDAKLKAISNRLYHHVSDELSNMQEGGTTGRGHVWKLVAAIALLVAFLGTPLEVTVGEYFVASFSSAYKSLLPTLFVLCLPIFAMLVFLVEKQQQTRSARYPTWSVRWLIMYPLLVVFCTGMLVFSPLGWSALVGRAIGTASPPLQAKVLSVSAEQRRTGKCDQTVELDFEGSKTRICAEDRVVSPPLKPGDTVSVHGRRSFLGFFIEEIQVMQPQ